MRLLVFTLAAMFAAPAQAEWLKATTRHFVVYSNTKPETLRRDATELETFDQMIRLYHAGVRDDDAEFNRVTVFVMPSAGKVEKMSGMRNVAGFYVPRVTGSIAFTPKLGGSDEGDLSPRIVLFHEYAHHFLLGNSNMAYPAWFSEGYAEFASTMKPKDGAWWFGGAANHRAYGLYDNALSIRQLFAPPEQLNERQTESLYARGWLLTHYLLFDEGRRKQLVRYLELFNAGKPSLDAATEAFGDLAVLDAGLNTYLRNRTIPALRINQAQFKAPTIDIRPLTPGEAALIGYRMESTRGVDSKTAPPLYAKASEAAAPFGKDAVAQGWLAEMAFDAGRFDAAEAAADAAIATDPASSQALLYKARVHMARVLAAKSTDAKAWTEARTWVVKANRAQTNDAAALALFYESFLAQKTPPSKSAIAGLYRAAVLVPQDPSLRFLAARQMILDGETAAAERQLRVLAAEPHSGANGGAARLLALLKAGYKGQGAIDALEKAAAASEAKPAS